MNLEVHKHHTGHNPPNNSIINLLKKKATNMRDRFSWHTATLIFFPDCNDCCYKIRLIAREKATSLGFMSSSQRPAGFGSLLRDLRSRLNMVVIYPPNSCRSWFIIEIAFYNLGSVYLF